MHPDHPQAPPPSGEPHDDIIYPATLPFVLVHLAVFGAIWTGVSAAALQVAVVLYLVRMWALTAGFHRYFSHRSYRTSRVFQFVLAFLAQTSAQRGAIWWAAIHRHHHRHSDTPEDVHSPAHMGFWASHVGWIFRPRRYTADYSTVRDLTRYPELVWLNRYHLVPAILLALACFLAGGWQMLVVGFFWSTVALYHGTFFINSLAHVVGKQRYVTGDDSRNNWWLALITLGEGWHNNHHHYQSATAQGWRWYEIDVTYYVLKLLSWVGVVRDLRAPPQEVVENVRPLGRRTVESVAIQVAATVPVRSMVDELRERWDQLPDLQEIRATAHRKRDEAEARLVAYLESLSHLDLPTVDDMRARVRQMYDDTPSLDEIAERARELVVEALSAHLLEPGPQAG
ncbi:MAG: fatty acid desaturase [Longimicrobiales bacterium]|nr:fatty acid desaturase [Longimicrobiales bacterium]